MGLIAYLGRRAHVWRWRVRYWWLDTPGGAQAQRLAFALSTVVVIVQVIYAGIAALIPAPARDPRQPQQAIIWWVVYLIVALVAAAVSFAMRPKAENKPVDQVTGPTTDDGQSVIRYWGTHWIDDEFLLGWKITGRDPIKATGGK
jgi:hypothetical protein